MGVPADLRYSPDHEWIRLEGLTATIGITDFAQDALGDIVFVQKPNIGLVVIAGATVAEVESTKSVSDIYAPVSGTVTRFNEDLENSPELMNTDSYGKGWLCTIELASAGGSGNETVGSGYDQLLDAAAYDALIGA
jgi:glycine cleavage system H protein